ncbi:MAG: hypothetical protein LH478_10045 [Chitinophagaceae bacterium]|nr:hypothetical protein [Chitinophagaceae bacterium]
MKKVVIFLLLWLFWGFAVGTLLLLGPVRWTVDKARFNSWSAMAENSIVYVYIGFLIIATFVIALYSVKFLSKGGKPEWLRRVLVVFPFLGSVLSLYAFLHPDIINADTTANKTISAQFAVGPYPELPKMFELKNEGYSAIISLLNPAIVPFEPSLIEKEKENALEAGLQFINIPLLPWISENEKAIDSLRHLVRTGKEKYYIHCYLGRDRTSVAIRIIEQENQTMTDLGLKKKHEGIIGQKFERGEVIELEKDVYLAPEPTKEEYFDVLSAFKQIVFISDLNNATNKKQLDNEIKLLKPYLLPITAFNITGITTPETVNPIVVAIQKLPKPVFIHGYSLSAAQLAMFKNLYQQAMK